jgi:hypothetical protein
MTEKDNGKKSNYNPNILGYAQVAAEYLNQGTDEGVKLAKKSLELILKDIGKLEPWVNDVLTNPEVIPKTIEAQLASYNEFKGKQTVNDLIGQYSADISKYIGDNAEAAKKELEGFKDEKYSDIIKKVGKSKYIIDGNKKFGIGSEEDVASAKKTMEKYQKVIQTFGMLERQYLSKFKTRVEDEVVKESLKEMYKPKEEKK